MDRRAVVRPWTRLALVALVPLVIRLAWKWRTGQVHLPLGFRMEDPAAEILTASLLAFVVVSWVVLETGHSRLAWLRWKPLRDLGSISYGLYLYHVPVLHSVDAFLPRSLPGFRVVEGLLTLSLTVAVATLSWRFIERPILRLKDRFDYRVPRTEPARPEPSATMALSLGRE